MLIKSKLFLILFLILLGSLNAQKVVKSKATTLLKLSFNTKRQLNLNELNYDKMYIPQKYQKIRKNNFDNSFLMDSLIATSLDGNKRILSFTYNSSGKINNINHDFIENGSRAKYSRSTYFYDSKGSLTSCLEEFWLGTVWINSALEEYAYNSYGQQVTVISEAWTNEGWINDFKSTNIYDSIGHLVSTVNENFIENKWIPYTMNENEYQKDGLLVKSLIKKWDIDNWVNYWNQEFVYDEQMRKSEVITKQWDGSEWINLVDVKQTYENDNINGTYDVTRLIENWNNSSWDTASRILYTFNKQNYFVNGSGYTYTNNRWIASDNLLSFENPDGYTVGFLAQKVQAYFSDPTSVKKEQSNVVSGFNLSQNYPNPFNPSTTINYQIAQRGVVKLKVFDMLGKEVASLVDEVKEQGSYSTVFNASKLASGVYYYRLEAGSFAATKKFILVK